MSTNNIKELSVGQESEHPVENWCHTKMKIERVNCTWTIENFSFRTEEIGESIMSSSFSGRSDDKPKWCLKLFPRGCNEKHKENLSLFIVLMSCNESEVKASLKMSELDLKGGKNKTLECVEAHKFYKGNDWGFHNLISRESLFTNATELLPDDNLTIFCEVSIAADTINVSGQLSAIPLKVPKCQLLNDLATVLKTPKFSDVTLSAQGSEFQAHKAILSARSPVFAAMFEHNMEERNNNRVEITDVDQVTFQELLEYMYTGKANNLEKNADMLLAAADKYALERLKVIREEVLCKKLSVKNAADILILADLHTAEHLKTQSINFIITHIADVTNTDSWKSMAQSHVNLVAECFRALEKPIHFIKKVPETRTKTVKIPRGK